MARAEGYWAVYTAVCLLAINGVLSKTIPLDAITVTGLRCLIAFIALAFFAYFHTNSWRYSNREIVLLGGLGLLMGIHWSCFFKGMQVSTIAIGILAHYTAPVITVVLEPTLDRKLPKLADIVAALLVLAGLAVMVPHWHWQDQNLWGVGFGVCSALALSIRNVLQRRWLKNSSSVNSMVIQVAVAALVCAPLSNFSAVAKLSPSNWVWVICLGLIGTALAHTLLVVALKHLAAKSVSLISCFQPPLAIALGWIFLTEIPSINTVVGGVIILGCAAYEAIGSRTRKVADTAD